MEHRWPKAGDASHEGLLKVERWEFRVQGLGSKERMEREALGARSCKYMMMSHSPMFPKTL